ncbi:hypothetical protein LTR28_004545 [Elasticomyces elasticus]|nr:hypothetical protein LTR28_004545 [Elasticomyces elasticus]
MSCVWRWSLLLGVLSTWVRALSTSQTVLILARDASSAYSAYSGLNGYGIPYQVVTVPSTGTTLPVLGNTATGVGNYGAIVILSEVAYQYANGFLSALTTAQWQQLYDYQTAFGVRMARLDVYPTPDFGTTTAIAGAGCCNTGTEQLVSISNATGFPTANLKIGATMSTAGLWHYPATITNPSIAWEVARFAPGGSFTTSTTAAVVNTIPNGSGTRQQMVWFTSFATDWSPTSNFLMHAWIHWATRGLYLGYRRIYFGTQVDDMFLETDLYQPAGALFRCRTGDLAAHVSWMNDINGRMPAGSKYFMEIGHNGNGDIEAANTIGTNACQPPNAIEYAEQIDTSLEFQKPLGSGTDIWPTTPASYVWSLSCARGDTLEQWWQNTANRDAFAHVTHTFTHEALNNATYADASREISFNVVWMRQIGLASGARFSGAGLIPPAITGLHNGDVIRAWKDNGLTNCVGDNTRPVLLNAQNEHWPLMTTVASNGYAGFQITPRWATTIYYNCDLPACTVNEWINTSGGSGDIQTLLADARATNCRHLLGLHHDPFMFHQANLRQTDVAATTVNGVSKQYSLLQMWVETVVQEMTRLVTWPIIALKHDDIAATFAARMTRDQCAPKMSYLYGTGGKTITGVTVTANGNSCSQPIPVTFPGPVTSTAGGRTEQVGSDPLTIWVSLSGSPVTFTLSTPVAV